MKGSKKTSEQTYRSRVAGIMNDKSISQENRQTIKQFLEHLELGKSIGRKKRKRLGIDTLYKYLGYLKKLSLCFDKPFIQLKQEDIDRFRTQLKNGELGKFSASTKRDIEYKLLRMTLIWLGKENIADFFDDYREVKEIPALKREQIEKMTAILKLRDKLVIWILFDGGFRAEEFLSIRYSDIKDDERKNGYYKLRTRISKTKPRTISVPLCTELLDQWLAINKDKKDSEEFLIPINYATLRKLVSRAAKAINAPWVTPHVLRHSSATYYCKKLNQYQLCLRYGWSMSSDMPKRYIDREGVEEDKVGESIINDEALKFREENKKLKEEMIILREKMDLIWNRFAKSVGHKNKEELIEGINEDLTL
ncbi:site-specific integrase [Candidatus Woesearchaeota archaeon]|nr:site-specific integrase [Candidatus Woesearchaeota archaeon]